eukprot:scaffold125_cov109-Cylindrotheca_fusiformis.AAC.2
MAQHFVNSPQPAGPVSLNKLSHSIPKKSSTIPLFHPNCSSEYQTTRHPDLKLLLPPKAHAEKSDLLTVPGLLDGR